VAATISRPPLDHRTKPDWEKPVLTLADGYFTEVSLPVDFIVDGRPLFPREGAKTNPEWM